MLDKKQIWAIFLFQFKMGPQAAETTCNINNTFSPGTANKCTVQWWFKKICKGDESLEDEEQSGWPSEVDNDHLRAIIKVDPLQFNSVQFSHSVVSDSLQPHESQHTRPPCPSPTPRVYPNSCPLSQWCHQTMLSSVVPFSSHLQLFPASGSFQMSQFFSSGGQSIGVSASASVLPMNTQDWSPLGWTGWISLQSKDSQESSPTLQFKSINSSTRSFL